MDGRGTPSPQRAPGRVTSAKRMRIAWLAPLLVGFSAASAAEIAVGILLYAGPGLMRSLTLVLGVEAAALGVGMWSASRLPTDFIEAVRKRWLLCLSAFLAAAAFAALWTFVEELGGAALGQGLGLAFLAALPMYACGGVLATIAAASRGVPEAPFREPGAPAAIGAAIGFTATGLLLPSLPSPSSLLLGCIALLSLGGLIQGSALARRTEVRVVAQRRETASDVRVEDRYLSSTALRVLLEGNHLRRRLVLHGEGELPWEIAVLHAALPDPEASARVLLVGGGASPLPRALLRERAHATIDVLERSPAVVELGREHLETGLRQEDNGRARILVGNLEDALRSLVQSYDLILVDGRALAPLGGVEGISRAGREALAGRLAAAGTLAWGPLTSGDAAPELALGWSPVVYEREMGALDADVSRTERILVRRSDGESLPAFFDGFRRVVSDPAAEPIGPGSDAAAAGEEATRT